MNETASTPEKKTQDIPQESRRPEGPGTEHVIRIPFYALVPSPTNPRKTPNPKADQALCQSIKENAAAGGPGVLEPLLCRIIATGKTSADLRYEVVAGGRRLKQAQKAGLDDVPCIVREMTDDQALIVQVVENLQRADISPLDEARGLAVLTQTMKVAAISKSIGKSASYVYQSLKLCDLSAEGQSYMEAGLLPASHAVLIARLPESAQAMALEWIFPTSRKQFDSDYPILSHRALAEGIRERLLISIDKAPFDPKDAQLIFKAGACNSCPKLSQNAGFDDVPKNTCTDVACYQEKRSAFVQITIKAAQDRGKPVLQISQTYNPKRKAKGVLYGEDYWEVSKVVGLCPSAAQAIYVDGTEAGETRLVCADPKCPIHRPKAEPHKQIGMAKTRKRKELIEARALGHGINAHLKTIRSLSGWDITRLIFEYVAQTGACFGKDRILAMKGPIVDQIKPILLKVAEGAFLSSAIYKDEATIAKATVAIIALDSNQKLLHPEKFRKLAAAEIKAESRTVKAKKIPPKKAPAKKAKPKAAKQPAKPKSKKR